MPKNSEFCCLSEHVFSFYGLHAKQNRYWTRGFSDTNKNACDSGNIKPYLLKFCIDKHIFNMVPESLHPGQDLEFEIHPTFLENKTVQTK